MINPPAFCQHPRGVRKPFEILHRCNLFLFFLSLLLAIAHDMLFSNLHFSNESSCPACDAFEHFCCLLIFPGSLCRLNCPPFSIPLCPPDPFSSGPCSFSFSLFLRYSFFSRLMEPCIQPVMVLLDPFHSSIFCCPVFSSRALLRPMGKVDMQEIEKKDDAANPCCPPANIGNHAFSSPFGYLKSFVMKKVSRYQCNSSGITDIIISVDGLRNKATILAQNQICCQ